MNTPSTPDLSNGYEARAQEFIAYRSANTMGADVVRRWAAGLPRGAAVLDLGCGPGVPITHTLVDAGLHVYAVDASPTMIAEFRRNFPTVPAACAAAEGSDYFGRRFDGAIAWGLLFLLPEESQGVLIERVAAALNANGSFLFTAPRLACTWRDLLTERTSTSLGADKYAALLHAAGLALEAEYEDEGENHYYLGVKR